MLLNFSKPFGNRVRQHGKGIIMNLLTHTYKIEINQRKKERTYEIISMHRRQTGTHKVVELCGKY